VPILERSGQAITWSSNIGHNQVASAQGDSVEQWLVATSMANSGQLFEKIEVVQSELQTQFSKVEIP
jgi:hypothetical protein